MPTSAGGESCSSCTSFFFRVGGDCGSSTSSGTSSTGCSSAPSGDFLKRHFIGVENLKRHFIGVENPGYVTLPMDRLGIMFGMQSCFLSGKCLLHITRSLTSSTLRSFLVLTIFCFHAVFNGSLIFITWKNFVSAECV